MEEGGREGWKRGEGKDGRMEEWKDGRVEEWKNRCGLLKDRFFRAGENYRVAEGSFFEKPKNDRVRMPISQSSTPLKE